MHEVNGGTSTTDLSLLNVLPHERVNVTVGLGRPQCCHGQLQFIVMSAAIKITHSIKITRTPTTLHTTLHYGHQEVDLTGGAIPLFHILNKSLSHSTALSYIHTHTTSMIRLQLNSSLVLLHVYTSCQQLIT